MEQISRKTGNKMAGCITTATTLVSPSMRGRTGLDHMSIAVTGRGGLDAWASWLDSLGVENSGVVDADDPVPYSVFIFRDPATSSWSSSTWRVTRTTPA